MKIIRLILLVSFFLSLPQWIKPDFKIPPTHAEIPFNPAWDIGPASPEILSILNQPFRYLAHGNQVTVFVSQDDKYVLKLFRYTRPRFSLIQQLKTYSAHLTHKKAKNDLATKMDKTFTATHLACTEGKEFTQALFCHLNLTQNKLPTIHLKASRNYKVPLDRHRFVLQRKVAPFKETLLAAQNDPEQMHQLIDSFLDLLYKRASLGIRNSDPNLGPNFGFLNGKAVELDFGNYRKAELYPHRPVTSNSEPRESPGIEIVGEGGMRPNEISQYISRLEHWLKKNTPQHLEYLRRKQSFLYDPQNETAEKPPRSSGTIR